MTHNSNPTTQNSHAYAAYLLMSGAGAFLNATTWVVGAVYYVLSVHMNPLQLVLVGTAMEVSYFIFQLPTGALADTYSRKWSMLIGFSMGGALWVVQGLVPIFAVILVASAISGLSWAMIDGAEEAWLSDELGKEHFGRASLRAGQVAQVGGLAGTFGGVALASFRLNLPIVAGGALWIVLSLALALWLPEHGFKPSATRQRIRWLAMRTTLSKGASLARGSSLILMILGLAVIFGAFSEGFDRLWEAHFLRDFSFPVLPHLKAIVWFGIINAGAALLSIAATQVVRRWVDMNRTAGVMRTLLIGEALIVAGVFAFAVSGNFLLALAGFWLASLCRRMNAPLRSTWLNHQIPDSSVRATVHSISGQADAFGQFGGGPFIGLVGTIFSLRAAIATAGLILLPALPLLGWGLRLHAKPPLLSGEGVGGEVEAMPEAQQTH